MKKCCNICSIDVDFVTLDDLIKSLNELKEYYSSDYENLVVKLVCEEYSDSNQKHPYLYGDREETEEERETRIKREKESNERRKEWELKQLEALKKKYEGEK